MDAVRIRAALKAAIDISSRANLYLQESKLDNALFTLHNGRCRNVMVVAVNVIYLLSSLLYPFIPDTSLEMLKQLNAPMRCIPTHFDIDILDGHVIGTPDYLFKRIEESVVDQLFIRFGGEQILKKRADVAAAAAKNDQIAAELKMAGLVH